MAQVICTEPALSDLDAIADYIALENTQAARKLVQRVFNRTDQLAAQPAEWAEASGFSRLALPSAD